MAITRYDPFTTTSMTLREMMDRMFEDPFFAPRWFSAADGAVRALPINMYETPDELVVQAYLPGCKPGDVQMSVEQNVLTIKARRPSPEESSNYKWIHEELWTGEAARTVTLPTIVQEEKAEAHFDGGVLTITLPKAEEVKPRQIPVKVKR